VGDKPNAIALANRGLDDLCRRKRLASAGRCAQDRCAAAIALGGANVCDGFELVGSKHGEPPLILARCSRQVDREQQQKIATGWTIQP
jgi:hypothetical protein